MSALVRLSRIQLSILLFIATYQSRYGTSPSASEIGRAHRVWAQSAGEQVRKLTALGYIQHAPGAFRSLTLTGKELA